MPADSFPPLVDDAAAPDPEPARSESLDGRGGAEAAAPSPEANAPADTAPADTAHTDPGPAAEPGFDLDAFLDTTQVEIMEPRYRVSPKAPVAWTLESCWSIIMLGALQVGWFYYGDNVMAFWNWVALVVTVWVGFFSLVVAPYWRYRVARWDYSGTAVYSRTGWWTHHYKIAPISRLQSVYTKRNLFERILGLGTVIASTASAHGSVEISGLPYADAETLADHLLRIAELDEGDAT